MNPLYRARFTLPGAAVGLLSLSGVALGDCPASETLDARYVIQGDTVHDTRTHLTWKRCSEGQRWDDAGGCTGEAELQIVEFDRIDSFGQWRLPTLRELQSLLVENCRNPSIDRNAFPGTVSGWYWTGTPPASRRWLVNFADGDVTYGRMRAAVRLVRSGR